MIHHTCNTCGDPIEHGTDLVNGELEIRFPATENQQEFLLRLQAVGCNSLQPTYRDMCRECLLKQLAEG